MENRIPKYPGRVQMIPVPGKPGFYDMVRADEPTNPGTPINKETLLSDETAKALGLNPKTATPDAAFARVPTAEVHVFADAGSTVTMTLGDISLSGIVSPETMCATIYPIKLGDWTVTYTYNGVSKSKTYSLNVLGLADIYPFTVGPDLEHTDWADISVISQFGLAEKFFKIGDKKTTQIDQMSCSVQIIGFNHDDLTAGGKAGITFQMVDALDTSRKMENTNTNANGWVGCAMRTKTISNFFEYGYIEPALVDVIKPVNKLTSAGGMSDTIVTSSDKMFLLSEIEIFGRLFQSKPGEGTQYEWYKAGNSPRKKVASSYGYWWERSPAANRQNFCLVTSAGGADQLSANQGYGVSVAFCV